MNSVFKTLLAATALFYCSLAASNEAQSSAPAGARVYIISPANGETVSSPVTIKFGLQGMGVAPAGFDKLGTGHHHLIIDGKTLPAMGKPMGAEVMHFGGGQTQKTIKLSAGSHSLQLILGNYLHIPHNPALVSEKIIIQVE